MIRLALQSLEYYVFLKHVYNGLVAQWITRLTTDQKIAGSNPAKIGLLLVNLIFMYFIFVMCSLQLIFCKLCTFNRCVPHFGLYQYIIYPVIGR